MDSYDLEPITQPPSAPAAPDAPQAAHKLPSAVYVLASMVTLGFFVAITSLMFVDIPHANVAAVNQLLGVLSGTFAGVLSFFFGSSLGSKRQGDALVDLANKKV